MINSALFNEAVNELRVEEIEPSFLLYSDPRWNRNLFITCWRLLHSNFLRVADEVLWYDFETYWEFSRYADRLINQMLNKYGTNYVPENLRVLNHPL